LPGACHQEIAVLALNSASLWAAIGVQNDIVLVRKEVLKEIKVRSWLQETMWRGLRENGPRSKHVNHLLSLQGCR